LHIHADGAAVLANAGHLAPYRNGEEISVPPSFPLGIIVDAEYTETSLRLAPGDSFAFSPTESSKPSRQPASFSDLSGPR
jgi:hypothetical protein